MLSLAAQKGSLSIDIGEPTRCQISIIFITALTEYFWRYFAVSKLMLNENVQRVLLKWIEKVLKNKYDEGSLFDSPY